MGQVPDLPHPCPTQVPDLPHPAPHLSQRNPGCNRYYFGMGFYRRRLPHWDPVGASIFVTWRLTGSLPRDFKALRWPGAEATGGARFAVTDRYLDSAVVGPKWLEDPRIAECVVQAMVDVEAKWKLCETFAWVVMPNHVHLLLRSELPLAEVMRPLKKNSAKAANAILGRTGSPFWQDESFDHWARSYAEFAKIAEYIEWNPVRAGLAERPEDWKWSSAFGRSSDGAGR